MSTVAANNQQEQQQRVEACSNSSQSEQSNELRRRLTGDRQTDGDTLIDGGDGGGVSGSGSGTRTAGGGVYEQTGYRFKEQFQYVGNPDEQKQTVKRKMRAQTYASTKSVAQGFLNISLLSANAGQLKVVLQKGNDAMFYELLLVMIGLSMFLQLLVSYLLASKHMMEMDGYEDDEEQEAALRHNRWATFIVTLISAVNVIISTFIGH